MIRVYGARDGAEAQFVKGLLEAEGIMAMVQGAELQVMASELPFNATALPSVWVDETDAERARQIVDEMRHGGPAALNPQPSWTCANCGTELEGQFTQCWKCGTVRDEATTQEQT